MADDTTITPPEQPLDPEEAKREKNRARCRAYYRRRRAAHPEIYEQAYRNRDAEAHREEGRRYYQRHKEEERARARAYQRKRRADPATKAKESAYRQQNIDKIKAQQREYRKTNAQEINRKRRVRRAQRHGTITGTHTIEDVQAQYKRQDGKCYWCKKKVGNSFHVDHVVPLAKGGSDGPENIVISCPRCNHRKSALHPMDWNGTLL